MFTGIIQHLGVVRELAPQSTGKRLVIETKGFADVLGHGESIAVNGCCLTLVASERIDDDTQRLRFDVIHQSLRMTTLGSLTPGRRVHLERSATPSTLLGGHIVQGHVDGVGEVLDVTDSGGEHRLRIAPPSELKRYIVDKGSMAIDGVSLTVASVDEASFEVALIPTTIELTTLGALTVGEQVNLEADALAKMVERLLAKRVQ